MTQSTEKFQSKYLYTRAIVDSSSISDSESGKTFDVVFATEAPVQRYGWDETFNEILSCTKHSIRVERLETGSVPLLNNHQQKDGVYGQLGIVTAYAIENAQCRATILFSTRQEFSGIWNDIKAKVIKSISCGYNVHKYIRSIPEGAKLPQYLAIDWEPLEISLAPVPADTRSQIRMETTLPNCKIEHELMSEKRETTTTQPIVEPQTDDVTTRNVSPEQHQGTDEGIAQPNDHTTERTRALEITQAVRAANLDISFCHELIQSGIGIQEARAKIIDKLAAINATAPIHTANNAGFTVTGDEKVNIRAAMSDALLNRAIPGFTPLSDKSADFRYMSLVDMARYMLMLNGETAQRYSASETIKRAIATTDYPNLLNSAVERSIRKTYDSIPAEWKQIAQQTTAKDFREKTGIVVDGKITFEEIAEGGEYKNSLILTDSSAKLKLKTYGRQIRITRQAIINDDLSVFEKLPKLIAQGAANFQADKVWNLVLSNTKTPDGKAIFHADHNNLASGADRGAPSEATLSKARTALWRVKTPTGEPMPVAAKWLIVPPELLTTAEKLMSAIVANATGDVNIFANKFQVITNPRLINANEWYLAADPTIYEGLMYCHLEGEEGLYVSKEIDFNDDAVVTKARLDFDAAAWDYRAWYKNPGL